jgi:hypothetical protein
VNIGRDYFIEVFSDARETNRGCESAAPIRAYRRNFSPPHRPNEPTGGKSFRARRATPRNAPSHRRVVHSRVERVARDCGAIERASRKRLWHRHFFIAKKIRDGGARRESLRAARTRRRSQRSADRSSRRCVRVRHSSGGFAVFCVVL